MCKPTKIEYPYLPAGKEIKYVPHNNEFMQAAKKVCNENTGCSWWPTGAVIVKNGKIIGEGANSGKLIPICPRVENNCPTGKGYHYCQDNCQQQGHSEITSINNCLAEGNDPTNADIYLFGHWWCCEPCWNHLIKHGIKNVFFLDNADQLFTREKRLLLQQKLLNKENKDISRADISWNKF